MRFSILCTLALVGTAVATLDAQAIGGRRRAKHEATNCACMMTSGGTAMTGHAAMTTPATPMPATTGETTGTVKSVDKPATTGSGVVQTSGTVTEGAVVPAVATTMTESPRPRRLFFRR